MTVGLVRAFQYFVRAGCLFFEVVVQDITAVLGVIIDLLGRVSGGICGR